MRGRWFEQVCNELVAVWECHIAILLESRKNELLKISTIDVMVKEKAE